MTKSEGGAIFFFDLGSPDAYLAAERISGLFAEAGLEQPEWQPILLGALYRRFGAECWAEGAGREAGVGEIERRAAAYGIPPIHWPDPWPGDTLTAMRAATFAKQAGRTVSFALAGFRQAFAGGRDLSDPNHVLVAAAACELHPRAVLSAIRSDAVKRALRKATEDAATAGVTGVPAVLVGTRLFLGDKRLADAIEFVATTDSA